MSFKKHLLVLFMSCLSLVSIAGSAKAQTLVQRRGSPRMMNGTRPLGMGNAFVATKGVDENAMFYNPAAINDYEEKVHFRFQLPTVDFSYKSIPFFSSDLTGLADDIDAAATNSAKVNVFNQFSNSNTGRYEEVGVRGNLVTMMHKYITASLFYDSQAVIGLTNPASNTVDIEALTQAGLVVGSAYSFFDDYLQAGMAVKFIGRHLIDQTVTQRDVSITTDFGDIFNFKNFGFGVGFDVGFKGGLPIRGKVWEYLDPKFALTVQDIGHTRFFAGDPVGQQKQSTSFGFALHPDFWKLKSTFVMDVRDIEYRTDFLNKFHTGYELTWPELSKVLKSISARVGVNQAYITAGLGLDFNYVRLDVATYGREIASNTIQKQSRMFTFQLTGGF